MANRDQDGGVTPLDGRTARLLTSAAAPAPLPAALRARLLALPATAEREDEEARRYERARALGLAAAAAGRTEVDTALPLSRAERAIAGWIAVSRRAAPLPAALRPRLLAIGRAARRPLPFWLVDLRFAAAACLILTLVSTVAVQDASALLGERASEVRLNREQWQARLAAGLGQSLGQGREEVTSTIRRGWHRGEQAFLSRAEAVRDLFEEKLRQFSQTELGRRLADEPSKRGNNDGPH